MGPHDLGNCTSHFPALPKEKHHISYDHTATVGIIVINGDVQY